MSERSSDALNVERHGNGIMILLIISTVCFGVAAAAASHAGTETYRRGLDVVEAGFRDKLRRLRVNTRRLRPALVAWSVMLLAMLLGLWLLADMLIIGVTLVVIMTCLPWYVVARMAEKRKELIEDQLADAMVALANAIKAGLSLAQALEILAEQTPEPICQEFQQIIGEYQLGKPLDRCLQETKERLRSENFALFAAAMEASRESGGRLNETVDRIAHSVRELQRLERKVIAETAQARASAFYMAMVPAIILAVYYFILDRENTERLFTTVPGQLILCASLILNIIAYLWARSILNPDI